MMTTPTISGLRLPHRLTDTVLDKETEYDGNLPDYCPDVIRLIRVDCTPYVDGCEISPTGDRVSISGRVLYDILYESDRKRKLRYCSFVQDFTHTADLPKNDLESLKGECSSVCSKITCKMLSPRHLSLHARLELHVVVNGEQTVPMLSTGQTEGVFFKETRFTYDAPAKTASAEQKFDETLSLLQGEKNIGEVVFGSVALQPPQVSVASGSATAKSNAVVKLLYEAEDNAGEYCMSVKNVPVSVTVESDAIGETSHTSLSLAVAAQNVSADLDQYGENRIIKAEFTVAATAVSVENKTAETAEDLFSSVCEEIPERTRIVVPELAEVLDRSFTVDLKIDPDEPPFSAIYDSTVRTTRVHADLVEGGVAIEGILTLSVLGESGDGIQHRDYVENFNQFVPTELPAHASGVMVEITPFEVLPSLHSDGSISARIICSARLFLYTEENVSFVCGIASQNEFPEEPDPYSLAYYFPTADDTLWSVSKRYRTDPKTVSADNPGAFAEDGSLVSGTGAVVIRKM